MHKVKPYNTGYLKVSDLHSLYYHEYGNPDGMPVIRLHGGPGSHSKSKHIMFYDLSKFRIILFDQRGCGKSTPSGECKQNTTQNLIEDIKKLKNHLNVDKFIIHGGSWGSTLALLYVQKYPNDIKAMILQGIYFGLPEEHEWIYEGGVSRFYPEKWKLFLSSLKDMSGKNNQEKSYNLFHQDKEKIKNEDIINWSLWEAYIAFLEFVEEPVDMTDQNVRSEMIDSARIMTHYLKNKMFLKYNQILNNIQKIPNVPISIVHGRLDLVCPVSNAYKLHQALSNSKLHIVQIGGHASSEMYMEEAMKEVIQTLK